MGNMCVSLPVLHSIRDFPHVGQKSVLTELFDTDNIRTMAGGETDEFAIVWLAYGFRLAFGL